MLLYHSPTSPYSRKVRIVLLEKALAYEALDVRSSGRSSSEHNPLGKVPTLVLDDGTALFDSVVITETLEALYPNPALVPKRPSERALVRRWEAIADGICDVVIPVVVESLRSPEQQIPAYQVKLLDKARACLRFINAELSGKQFLHGITFTLADIAVVSMAGYLNLRRPDLLAEGYPELLRYLDAHAQRPSFVATTPPNLPISA